MTWRLKTMSTLSTFGLIFYNQKTNLELRVDDVSITERSTCGSTVSEKRKVEGE